MMLLDDFTQADAEFSAIGRSLREEVRLAAEKVEQEKLAAAELKYARKSLYQNFMKWLSGMVRNKTFDNIIIVFIFLNCIFMAMEDPTLEGKDESERNYLQATVIPMAELIFAIIFTVEFGLKCVVYGPGEYLSDNWNRLDCLIVGVSWFGILSEGGGNFSSLRVLRVLRPLRTVNKMPGLKVLITTLFNAGPNMFLASSLYLTLFLIYGCIGLHVWGGTFHQRCFSTMTGSVDGVDDEVNALCGVEAGSFQMCSTEFKVCAAALESPRYGILNYDHLGTVSLLVFQVIAMEGWANLLYMTMDVSGPITMTMAILYFLSLVILGGFLAANLFLAVIKNSFVLEEEAANRRALAKEETERLAAEEEAANRRERGEVGLQVEEETFWEQLVEICCGPKLTAVVAPTPSKGKGKHREEREEGDEEEREEKERLERLERERVEQEEAAERETERRDEEREKIRAAMVTAGIEGADEEIIELEVEAEERACSPCCGFLRPFVLDKRFERFFIFLILVNVLLLCMEYDGMHGVYIDFLENGNTALTLAFLCEMIVKISALGVGGYVSDGFNIFDAFIVITSLFELLSSGGGGGFKAFRAGRLLKLARLLRLMRAFRVLRVLKYVAPLRKIMAVIQHTVGALGWVSMLLGLAVFFFAILGMQLFGGKFTFPNEVTIDRNYDTFFSAVLTVFSVITLDDWPIVMYYSVRATGSGAIFYYVALIVVGNFIVFNLLLAVMLTQFEKPVAAVEDVEVAKKLTDSMCKVRPGQGLMMSWEITQDKQSEEGLEAEKAILEELAIAKKSGDKEMIEDRTKQVNDYYQTGVITEEIRELVEDRALERERQAFMRSLEEEERQEEAAIKARSRVNSKAGTPLLAPSSPDGKELGGPIPVLVNTPNKAATEVVKEATKEIAKGALSDETVLNISETQTKGSSTEFVSEKLLEMLEWSGDERDDEGAVLSLKGDALAVAAETLREEVKRRGKEIEGMVELTVLMSVGGMMPPISMGLIREEAEALEASMPHLIVENREKKVKRMAKEDPGGLMKTRLERFQARLEEAKQTLEGMEKILTHNEEVQRKREAGRSESGSGTCSGTGSGTGNRGSGTGIEIGVGEQEASKKGEDGKRRRSTRHGPAYDAVLKELGHEEELNDLDEMMRDEAEIREDFEKEKEDATGPSGKLELMGLEGTSECRVILWDITHSGNFSNAVLMLIIMSCVQLAWETYAVESWELTVLSVLDVFLTLAFLLEMFCKVSSNTFLDADDAYLKDSANQLDFFIICVSVCSMLLSGFDLAFLKSLRTLRCIRPLRVLSRSESMMVVIRALITSIPGIANVGLFLACIFVVFGILGGTLFRGQSNAYCSDHSVTTEATCVGSFLVGEASDQRLEPRKWRVSYADFDNMGSSVLTLLEVMTLEGWSGYMHFYLSRPGGHWVESAFFIAWVGIAAIFMLNLFIGIVFQEFTMASEGPSGFSMLTDGQRDWVMTTRNIFHMAPKLKPELPADPWRRSVVQVVSSNRFENLIAYLITANVVVLMVHHYDQPVYWETTLVIFTWSFNALFFLEAVFKIYGYGFSVYIEDAWNKFDLFLVATSFIDVLMDAHLIADGGPIMSVLRVFRIFRVMRMFRLAKHLSGLRKMASVLLVSLPSIVNVGSLLLIFYFMFGVLGCSFFSKVPLGGKGINRHVNFQNLGYAMMTLFQISTGEDWISIMHDCMGEVGVIASVYFVVFILCIMFVLINVFVACVVDNMKVTTSENVNYDDFSNLWSKYDEVGDGWLPGDDLLLFLAELGPPIGFPPDLPKSEYVNFITDLNIPSHEGEFHFSEVLFCLARRIAGASLPESMITEEIERHMKDKFPVYQKDPNTIITAVQRLAMSKFCQKIKEKLLLKAVKAHLTAGAPFVGPIGLVKHDITQEQCLAAGTMLLLTCQMIKNGDPVPSVPLAKERSVLFDPRYEMEYSELMKERRALRQKELRRQGKISDDPKPTGYF